MNAKPSNAENKTNHMANGFALLNMKKIKHAKAVERSTKSPLTFLPFLHALVYHDMEAIPTYLQPPFAFPSIY